MSYLHGNWIVTKDARFLAEEVVAIVDRGQSGSLVYLKAMEDPIPTAGYYQHIGEALDQIGIGFLKVTVGQPKKQE